LKEFTINNVVLNKFNLQILKQAGQLEIVLEVEIEKPLLKGLAFCSLRVYF